MEPDRIYWEAAFHANVWAEMLLMGYILYRFASPFMKHKRGAGCAGVVYSLTMMALYVMPPYLDKFLAYAIGAFVAFLAMCRADKKNYTQKLFIAATFFSLRWFTYAMAEILYDKLYDFAEHTDYMAAHPEQCFALYIGVCVCYLAMGALFMAVGVRCILKAYTYKDAAMEKKELLVLVIPSFMGVAGYEVMAYYRSFYIGETGTTSDLYDVLALLYYAAALVAIVVMIVLYQSIKAGQEEKLQSELLAAQHESIRYHIGQVESLYENIRSLKHDMTNHILTLEGLYAADAEAAKGYSEDLKAALADMAGTIKSGNPVTDVILQEMKDAAEKRNIRFQSDFHYPAGSGIEAFDISVILNNALQNALEGAQGEANAQIAILSYRKNNAYMIEITNSFSGGLDWDARSGLPVTSKKKKDSHGYGLSNIRRVAEKYYGDIDIAVKDGEFCLSIMMLYHNT